MSDQNWRIPVTPAQRWVLFNVSHQQERAQGQQQGSPSLPLSGQAGRVFRRFARAFGLEPISEVAREHGGAAAAMARDRRPRLHTVTIENIEQALKVQDVPHSPADEMAVGELFDLLEEVKRSKEYATPEGIEDYDQAAENWVPVKADPVELTAERIASYVRARGAAELADDILRGEWDTEESDRRPDA